MSNILALTPEQMREVDNLMMKYYGIEVLQMMEHDARGLVEVAKQMFRGVLKDKRVLVVSGKGGNGAGGLASVRHFHNAGAEVEVVLAGSERSLSKEGKHHLKTLKKLGVLTSDNINIESSFDLVIDALLGYSAIGDPRLPYDKLILNVSILQRSGAKVLSNDLPSGLDVVSGLPHRPCVKADVTMTIALPKVGLLEDQALPWIGKLYLVDIGVPVELYGKMGIEVARDLFEDEWVYKIN